MTEHLKSGAALMLFSGGQDSATCLAWALARFERVETIGFAYGQRHGVEMQARECVRTAMLERFPEWGARLGNDVVVDISGYGALAESALTREAEFALSAKGLPTTFVPARNLVFLTIAGAHAYRRATPHLVTGVCQTDFSGYPDCRDTTIRAQEQALSLGLDEAVHIDTPLMHLTKAQTWALAHELGGDALVDLIVEESHTCYRGDREHRHAWGYGCGDCPACDLRATGWAQWRGLK